MRLLTYRTGEGTQAGILLDEDVVPVSALDAPASSVRSLLQALDADGLAALARRARDSTARLPLASLTLAAPVPDPEKVVCLGLNYSDHARETGQEPPAAICSGSTKMPIGLAWNTSLVCIHFLDSAQSPKASHCSSTWFPSGSL